MKNSCTCAKTILEHISLVLVELCLTNVSGEMLLSRVYLQVFSYGKSLNKFVFKCWMPSELGGGLCEGKAVLCYMLFYAIWGCKKIISASVNNSFQLVLMQTI